MRVGLSIGSFSWPGGGSRIAAHLRDIVRTAEEAGFYSAWVMDHYFQIPYIGEANEPMLEGYTTLGYLAASTDTIKLGTLVSGVVYRNPGILVKTVTTLDILSGGRAYLGLGGAWFDRETRGLGIPFPTIGVRLEQVRETLQIALQMWRPESEREGKPFAGKHFQMDELMCSPQPLSRPRPKILIGGMGEKKTLRLVAEFADACNLFSFAGPEVLSNKLEILKRHCDDVGRPYDAIEKTVFSRADFSNGTVRETIAQCKQLAELGFEQVIFAIAGVHELAPLRTFGAEIIPAIIDF